MDKLIELIERYRDKWQKKWTKGTQLRDSNSEHYDPFLHGASVGATKAYNNVLQWIKNPSIMSGDKDLALTWEDVKIILCKETDVLHECNHNIHQVIDVYSKEEDYYGEILKRFNEQREKK